MSAHARQSACYACHSERSEESGIIAQVDQDPSVAALLRDDKRAGPFAVPADQDPSVAALLRDDRWVGLFVALLAPLIALAGIVPSVLADEGEPPELLTSDSRAPYVHRITLYDHDGQAIDPTDELAGPYSPRATCSKCHAYALISHGWHFNANDPSVPPGRPGEPWFLVDKQADTQLPISGRDWPGVSGLEEAGLTNWQFVKLFGRHMPGGGFAEPSDELIANSPEAIRWGISGKLEIDCMFCHSADQQHDPAEAARQIEMENFKWAPTAALGLAVIRGEARKAPDDWDPLMPPDPDFPERAGPRLVWDLRKFDPDDRVFFNITRRIPNERCYFCHSFRAVGPGAPDEALLPGDVHMAAGLLCVDCHRNGLDHRIIRGYRTEALHRQDVSVAAYSCEGCHLGVEGASDPELARGGHLGAPYPEHGGLPPLHFERMACTACHSGPWPSQTMQVQTALAHALGIATREERAGPWIGEPAFARGADERIGTHRIAGSARAGPLEPLVWPMAHDVRPAAQSVGARDCYECHGREQLIFRGEILCGDVHVDQSDLHGYDKVLSGVWVLGFAFRPTFKWFAFFCAGIVTLVLLRNAANLVAGGGAATSRGPVLSWRWLDRFVLLVATAGFCILAITGFGASWVLGEVEGLALFAHMLGAPLFVIGLTGIALIWPRRCAGGEAAEPSTVQQMLFWIAFVLAYVNMMSMLVAMLPTFGTEAQKLLIEIHAYSALLLLLALLAFAGATLAARQARRQKE